MIWWILFIVWCAIVGFILGFFHAIAKCDEYLEQIQEEECPFTPQSKDELEERCYKVIDRAGRVVRHDKKN